MPWLWFIGPVLVVAIYLLTTTWPGPRERRRRAEARRWANEYLPPLKKKKDGAPPRFLPVPGTFEELLDGVGGGTPVLEVMLVSKLAFLTVRAADAASGSDHQTVVCKLDKAAPRMTVRPTPIVDGKVAAPVGVSFPKDPEFAACFVVEAPGVDPKAVRRWLGRDLREALLECPDAWLRTDGTMAAVTLYGDADADRIDALVATADTLYAEHGASGASLFGKRTEGVAKAAAQAAPDALAGGSYRSAPQKAPKAPRTEPTPKPKKQPQAEDGTLRGRRVTAGVIDGMLYGIALLLLATILGAFPSFHPMVLFQSPDPVVTEPWQGGWTTKGVGAFIACEALLLGLVVAQAWLHASRGQSIGKLLCGVALRRLDQEPLGFRSAVLQRTWLLALVVLAVNAVLTRPFSWNAFFANVATPRTAAIAALVGIAAAVPLFRGDGSRALQDYLAGTEAVMVKPWQGLDRTQRQQVLAGLGVLGMVTGLALVALIGFEWISWVDPFRDLIKKMK